MTRKNKNNKSKKISTTMNDSDDDDHNSDNKKRRVLELVVFDLDYTIWDPEMYQLCGKPTLVDAADYNLSKKQLEESRTIHDGKILVDTPSSSRGRSRHTYQRQPMRVFSGAAYALSDIYKLQREGYNIRAAIASRTDEPRWAQICLENLAVKKDYTFSSTSTSSSASSSSTADDTDDDDNNNGASTTTSSSTNDKDYISLYECFNNSKKLIEISFNDKTYHFRKLQQTTGISFSNMVFFDNESWNIENVQSTLGVYSVYTPNGMNKYDYWDKIKDIFEIKKHDEVDDDGTEEE